MTSGGHSSNAAPIPPAANPAVTPDRVEWIDYVKGLIMLYVVFYHVNDGINWQTGGWLAGTQAFFYWYHNAYPMAAFFFFSGLFLARTAQRPYSTFLINRLRTGAYPYVVWVVLFTFLSIAMSGHTNSGSASLAPITHMAWDPPFHYWFLYALFLIAVIWVSMRKLGVDTGTLLLIFAVLYVFQSLLRGMTWHGLHFVASQGVFVALGAHIGLGGALRNWARARSWILVVTIAASIIVIGYLTVTGIREHYWGLLLLNLMTFPGTFALGILLDRVRVLKEIRRWGQLSLEIYVAHVFGTAAVRIALEKILGIDSVAVHTLAGIVAGLYLPILLVVVTNRLRIPWLFRLEPRPPRPGPPVPDRPAASAP